MRKGNAVLLAGRTAFFVRIPSGRHTVFGLFDMRQPAVSRGASWRFGDLEIWRFGDLEIWRFGDLEIWRFGDLEIWRFGDFSCRSIPFAPLSVAGIPKPFRMEALCRTADFFRGLPEGEGNRVKNIWSGSEVKNDGPVGSRRYFRYFYGSAKKRGGSRSRTRDSDCREAVRSARMRRYGVFRTNRRPN